MAQTVSNAPIGTSTHYRLLSGDTTPSIMPMRYQPIGHPACHLFPAVRAALRVRGRRLLLLLSLLFLGAAKPCNSPGGAFTCSMRRVRAEDVRVPNHLWRRVDGTQEAEAEAGSRQTRALQKNVP